MAHTRGIHHCHQGDRPILGKGQVDRGLIRGMILKMVNKLIGSAKRRSIISKIAKTFLRGRFRISESMNRPPL